MLSRDDIIRMAQEAGISIRPGTFGVECWIEDFERFAALVAAAEREACARVCDDLKWHWPPLNFAENCAAAIRAQAADRLARHGIQLPDENEEYGNPSF